MINVNDLGGRTGTICPELLKLKLKTLKIKALRLKV